MFPRSGQKYTPSFSLPESTSLLCSQHILALIVLQKNCHCNHTNHAYCCMLLCSTTFRLSLSLVFPPTSPTSVDFVSRFSSMNKPLGCLLAGCHSLVADELTIWREPRKPLILHQLSHNRNFHYFGGEQGLRRNQPGLTFIIQAY
jgi:hypothetical protein